MSEYMTVSQVAEELRVRPRDISDALYQRRIDATRCPRAGHVRLIPRAMLADIRAALRATGKVPEPAGA